MSNPVCKKCRNTAIPADAGVFKSIPYWYCRTCKIEVTEYGYEVKPRSTQELDDYLSGELLRFGQVDMQGDIFTPESIELPADDSGFFVPKKDQKIVFKHPSMDLDDEDDEDEEGEGLDYMFGHHW